MELGLKGRTALVTGGTSGIGLALAQCLAREGATIIVASRNEKNLKEAARVLEGSGKVSTYTVDLLDEKSIAALIEQTKSAGVDILVNNVGGPAAGQTLDISLEGWDKGYRSLLRSVVQLSLGLVPEMRKKKWGRVLTITSTSAAEVIPRLPVSGTFRAGLSAWAKGLAKEVGRDGVLVNNLLPGPTKTARLEELADHSPEFFKTMAEKGALGRIAEPDEIARVGAFLCSSANGYITGTDILVDGGYTSAL